MKILNFLFAPLRALDLTKRFMLLMACLVALTVFSAQWFYVRQSRTYLELRLQEKAAFINKFYSYVISGLLMRKDDIGLQQVINTLEEDREISSVIVVDQKNRIRYHIDAQKVGLTLEDDAVKSVLARGEPVELPFNNSGGKALALLSPLKIPGSGQLLGAARIDLTYHAIESQMTASGHRFWFITLGSVVTCVGILLSFLGRWVLFPLQRLRVTLEGINPARPDSNLPEMKDEFGQIYAAVNALTARVKDELQQQQTQQTRWEERERTWAYQLVESFMPEARVLLADKHNRVVPNSRNGARKGAETRHLLDLIKDANFANLLNDAFQKEGTVVRGVVTFEDKSYQATILSVLPKQSVMIKTLIALQPKP